MKVHILGETEAGADMAITLIPLEVDSLCGVGTDDCCIFLSIGPDGWNCERLNSPIATELLNRSLLGKMNATRHGCDFVNNLDVNALKNVAIEFGGTYIFPEIETVTDDYFSE